MGGEQSREKAKRITQAAGKAVVQAIPGFADLTLNIVENTPECKNNPECMAAIAAVRQGKMALQTFAQNFKNQLNKIEAEKAAETLRMGSNDYYQGAAEMYANELGMSVKGGADGGACGCQGGDDEDSAQTFIGAADMDVATVREYADSLNSVTKDNIVNDIIEALKKMGLNAEGKTREETVKKILELVPDGKSKKFKESEESHKRICLRLADVINERYGNKIIDKNLDPALICQQVAEVISSLSASMHTEFLNVQADVKKIIKNLEILRQSLQDDFDQVMDKIKSSNDPDMMLRTTQLTDLHNMLLEEVARQLKMLQNLLNITLLPTEVDLQALIKHKKNINGYIERIDVKPGKSAFGDVISNVLKGLGLTANFALLIDRALKTVGITVDEYARSDDLKDLIKRVNDHLLTKKMDEEALHQYLQAAELLYKNFYRNKDIAKILRERSGKFEEMRGGDEDDDKYHKTVIDRSIADRRRLRNLIMNAFYKQSNQLFDAVIKSTDLLGKKLGTEIPLSDQLDGFRDIMGKLTEGLVRNKQIYWALIGYYNDALSKSKRDTFLAELRMVSSYIDSILEMSIYKASAAYFKDIQTNIKALIELIDKFSDEVAAKFGRGELEPATGAADDEEEPCLYLDQGKVLEGKSGSSEGGIDEDFEGSLPVEIKRKPTDIREAFRKFDYYYKVAQIKQNLSKTAKEIDSYSEKYERLLASAVADKLNEIKKEYDENIAVLKAYDVAPGGVSIYGAADAGAAEAKRQKEAAIKFMDDQYAARKRFWQTVEAVDTYMRAFTDGIIKNPQDIKDIKSMLDEIEIISNWYNEATGNHVDQVFESFPSYLNALGNDFQESTAAGDAAVANARLLPADSLRTVNDTHLYAKVGAQITVANDRTAGHGTRDNAANLYKAAPGNPYVVTDPTSGQRAKDNLKKVTTGLAMLKNLISVFVHIGSKFGGEELRKKTFMTPTQIYNNLCEFIQASAFSQTLGQYEAAADKKTIVNHAGRTLTLNLSNGQLEVTRPMMKHNAASAALAHAAVGTAVAGANAVHGQIATHAPGSQYLQLGVTAGESTDLANNLINFRQLAGVFMRSHSMQTANGQMPLAKGFQDEDEYFVLIIKSIGAKIFTVVGMYDLFDRPFEKSSFHTIRMILGGADDIPKVETEATELYLRLPLFAQFYRNLFTFDGNYNDANPADDSNSDKYESIKRKNKLIRISMVPDIEGIWSGLIQLVFRKAKFIDNQAYSDNDIRDIIKEVNLIYNKMKEKYPQNTVYDTLQAFAAEVNRRYALVSKEERDKYEREFGYRYDYAQYVQGTTDMPDRYTQEPDDDFAILPGEEDPEVRRPAPSERFLSVDLKKETEKYNLFNVTQEHKRLLYKFRCALDKHFANPEEQYTFRSAIKSAQMKLKKETNDAERLKIVSSLIRGVDIYSKNDNMKYLLLHETVVSGLNTLSAIHTMLVRFQKRVLQIDMAVIDDAIDNYLCEANAAKAINLPGLVTAVRNEIRSKYTFGDEIMPNDYADVLFGKNEAWNVNGGHVDYTAGDTTILKRIGGVPESVPGVGGGAVSINVPRYPDALGNFGLKQFDPATDAAIYPNAKVIPGRTEYVYHNNNASAGGAPLADAPGLLGLLNGQIARELKGWKLPGAKPRVKQVMETIHRYIYNREFIMKEFIETIFGISKDLQGMIDVKIEDGRIYLNFNNLKQVIDDMFSSVTYFIDFLRPYIKKTFLEKYVMKQHPGSLYWLQEQLYEKILQGRFAQSVESEQLDATGQPWTKKKEYPNLEMLSQKLNTTYLRLTQKWSVDAAGVSHNAQSAVHSLPELPLHTHFTNYDRVLSEIIFYDASKPQSGLISSKDATFDSGPQLSDYLGKSNLYEPLLFNGTGAQKVMDTRYVARYKQLYNWDEDITYNRSLLFMFNQLVAKYIQQFYDTASQKIYINVINAFTSGAFNRSIMDQMYTYPDTWPAVFLKTADRVGATPGFDDKVNAVQLLGGNLLKYDTEIQELLRQVRAKNTGRGGGARFTATAGDLTKDLSDVILAAAVAEAYNVLVAEQGAGNGGNTMDGYQEVFNILVAACLGNQADAAGAVMARPADVLTDLGRAIHGAVASSADISVDQLHDYFGTVWVSPAVTPNTPAVAPNTPPGFIALVENAANGGWAARQAALDAALGAAALAGVGNFAQLDEIYRGIYTTQYQNSGDGSLLVQALRISPLNNTGSDSEIPLTAAIIETLADGHNAARTNLITEAIRRSQTIAAVNGITSREQNTMAKYDDVIIAPEQNIASPIPTNMAKDKNFIRLATQASTPEEGGRNLWEIVKHAKPRSNPPDFNWGLATGAGAQFGNRLDPDPERILFTSLSVLLRNILTSKNVLNQALVYIQDNINDVSLSMKEKYRAEMPIFRNLFKELMTRVELAKRFLSRDEVQVRREWPAGAPTNNPWPGYLSNKVTAAGSPSDEVKIQFNQILDAINKGCTAFLSAIEQILREVGDDPKYFETYQNSIKDYKNQYGKDPLMPISSMLNILANTDRRSQYNWLPLFTLGQDQFKLHYGTRLLFGNPTIQPLMDHIPGFALLIGDYNMMVDSREQVQKDKAELFMKSFVKLTRYLLDLKHYKGLETTYFDLPSSRTNALNFDDDRDMSTLITKGSFVRANMVSTFNLPTTNRKEISIINRQERWDAGDPKPVFSIVEPLAKIMNLTESSFKEDKINEIVKYLIGKSAKSEKTLEVQNIVDLNIIPINVHALMRELPLVNLYNYAYTFDRLIIELFYGFQNENARKMILDLCDNNNSLKHITSAKDMFIALLLNPYLDVFNNTANKPGANYDTNYYEKYVKRIFRGDTQMELGRPKFLSDQLFNKSLFGEVYDTKGDYDEAGPAVGNNKFAAVVNAFRINAIANWLQVCNGTVFGEGRILGGGLSTTQPGSVSRLLLGVARYAAALPTPTFNQIHAVATTLIGSIPQAAEQNAADSRASLAWSLAMTAALSAPFINKVIWLLLNNGTTDLAAEYFYGMLHVVLSYWSGIQANRGYWGLDVNYGAAIGKIQWADATVQSAILNARAGGMVIYHHNNGAADVDPEVKAFIRSIVGANFRDPGAITPATTTPAAAAVGAAAGGAVAAPPATYFSDFLNAISAAKGYSHGEAVSNNFSGQLTYLVNPAMDLTDSEGGIIRKNELSNNNIADPRQVKAVDVSDLAEVLHYTGRLRFDTVFIRNLLFIVNLYRSVRLKLSKDLTYSKDIIQKSYSITRPEITEYNSNEVFAPTQHYSSDRY